MSSSDEIASTFKVLVATDNHIGYLEKDPIRGNDSFDAFEEILKIAKEQEVDFLLLGGDLFHENKPSRTTLYRTMELLRTYCLGDRPISFEILNDQSLTFHSKFGIVNYEDPNYNIEIPVFSIHGNHDDPAGDGRLAGLDILSVSNLVNYFGKSENVDDIKVYPILLKKGETQIALYGLGNIRDERLYRTFNQKKVTLVRPSEEKNNWFNILVLHQNRVAHSPKNYIHETMIDAFLDFVIWGHEHECLVNPTPSSVGGFYISQPGSSVATSLSEGEAKKKHVGLLEIYKDKFRLSPIPLKSVRPFILEDVVLSSEELDPEDQESIVEFLHEKVEQMLAKAHSEVEKPTVPLVRLKVEYSGGFSTVNPQRFGQRFVGRVANPNDILLFYKKRTTTSHSSKHAKELEKDMLARALRTESSEGTKIEDLIEKFLSDQTKGLDIFPETGLNWALSQFVEKDDKSAFKEYVVKTLEKTRKTLMKEDPEKTLQSDYIEAIVAEKTALARNMERQKDDDQKEERSPENKAEEESEFKNEEEEIPEPPKKTRKSTKQQKAIPSKQKAKPKTKKGFTLDLTEENEDTIVEIKQEEKKVKKKRRIDSISDLFASSKTNKSDEDSDNENISFSTMWGKKKKKL